MLVDDGHGQFVDAVACCGAGTQCLYTHFSELDPRIREVKKKVAAMLTCSRTTMSKSSFNRPSGKGLFSLVRGI
jgi:hypothetical protein